jgi:hypothetical protein
MHGTGVVVLVGVFQIHQPGRRKNRSAPTMGLADNQLQARQVLRRLGEAAH